MDQKSFDQLTRLFGAAETRRAALRFVLGAFLGGTLVGGQADAIAPMPGASENDEMAAGRIATTKLVQETAGHTIGSNVSA